MTYTLVWERAAAEGLKKLRKRDGAAVKPFVQAINALAANPKPAQSSQLGSINVHRLRTGAYRATYEIDGHRIAIKVLMVGSTPIS